MPDKSRTDKQFYQISNQQTNHNLLIKSNDELVDANATEYTLPAVPQVRTFANARNMFVTAVYADGEAEPSNTVNVDDATSGVEGVAADNDNDATVEYFNLQGVRVDNPGHGIYIRRQGNKVSKTSVR